MLVKFSKIEKLLRYCLPLSMRPCSACPLRFIHLLEVRVLLVSKLEQVGQVSNAVVRFLLCAANHSYEGTLVASVYYGRALVLMGEELFVWHHLLAPLVSVAASEHQLA